ncbi:MAG TPA: phospho-N-acetylmuramoyl-pentapeptide-transferase [Bacteroidales bacterium]|jgi:phospho-N-acetylmuramoyl-pentapeptide-transferase|nr:phospho-N-acetylmuramoyl-pentapeptide-transferase [Bacteroidales bacterium]MDI9574693.1 phospho-N-acetylmuramoyl-pentapeptide-transferase [Bacteroidota bacterium]OQC60840.1 MAG: Phospho-N-acetylmuramoyl-pentapeptide-transferase [Bacteroidetes bacterium ADurb.Bin012]MBP9511137.1 phospho-N-acetylmuramoyl-pentapeptide-transferase [Bacteroidales bacterium]MBP9588365.1 phospho-N-acetylmuramoyl-pentapeptide-transferase [Bacteroidales bacterium]
MLYYLFTYFDLAFDFPGAGLFQYISFRAASAVILSLIITLIFGGTIIQYLKKRQIGEEIRDLGLEGQLQKRGTPTMGGLMIIAGIVIPTLLFARLDNVYIILMIITTLWLGFIGFVDDYIKVFKKNKEGLQKRTKLAGQVILGIVVGVTMYFSPDIVIREKTETHAFLETTNVLRESNYERAQEKFTAESTKSLKTTIPFVKNNEFDYAVLVNWIGKEARSYAWLVYIPIIILIITAVSNGVNLTDGLDGLAGGTSAVAASTLGILAWVSGNIIFADYLNIMYIPNTGELAIFISSLVGATIGFLWYNTYPAQVFMGDTGSLTLGGIIAVIAIIIRKELLIPILCGIFLAEALSVLLQVTYFKYTKRRFKQGRRIFKMAPLHHHYQILGYHEAKIVQRFMIVSFMLAVITIITLKIR